MILIFLFLIKNRFHVGRRRVHFDDDGGQLVTSSSPIYARLGPAQWHAILRVDAYWSPHESIQQRHELDRTHRSGIVQTSCVLRFRRHHGCHRNLNHDASLSSRSRSCRCYLRSRTSWLTFFYKINLFSN